MLKKTPKRRVHTCLIPRVLHQRVYSLCFWVDFKAESSSLTTQGIYKMGWNCFWKSIFFHSKGFHSILLKYYIVCFLHAVAAISKRWKSWCHVFASNHNSNISTHGNSNDNVQNAVDLTIPAKNRRKMSIIDLNFQIKKFIDSACRLVWNWPSKSTTQSLIFCEM